MLCGLENQSRLTAPLVNRISVLVVAPLPIFLLIVRISVLKLTVVAMS
jgi:hypothetical protein